MLWFQLKPGVALDSLREVHCAAPDGAGGELRSWCHHGFHLGDVQEVSDPTLALETDQTAAGAPCVGCLLRIMATVDHSQHRSTAVPLPAGNDGEFAVLMRKAQWLLDDAAHYLPEGRCNDNDLTLLAETLDQLASIVRAQARRPVVINPMQ